MSVDLFSHLKLEKFCKFVECLSRWSRSCEESNGYPFYSYRYPLGLGPISSLLKCIVNSVNLKLDFFFRLEAQDI